MKNAILYTLNRLEKGDTIKNVGGYIVKMAKQETIIDPAKKERAATKNKKKAAAERQQQKANLEKELKSLFKKIHREEMEMIDRLIEEHPTAKASALDAVRLNPIASISYDSDLSDAENLKKPAIQGAYVHEFKKAYPQPFIVIDKKYSSQVKILKRQIAGV